VLFSPVVAEVSFKIKSVEVELEIFTDSAEKPPPSSVLFSPVVAEVLLLAN
jgi:hypothetical protein